MKIGFLGGGQLAKMSALSAFRLGIDVAFYEITDDYPSRMLSRNHFVANWEDRDMLKAFAQSVDFVTLENEFLEPNVLSYLESLGKKVVPSSSAIAKIQDKFIQKKTLEAAGLPVPIFAKILNADEARGFGEIHGYPFLLKARKQGYDGYGNRTIHRPTDVEAEMKSLGFPEKKLYAEAFVKFEKELATMVAKNKQGDVVVYPVVETVQKKHICTMVKAPALLPDNIRIKAEQIAREAIDTVMGQGILAVEMFLVGNDILINELAPRPHNSGHYSIEACNISQFETHVRAVANIPLKKVQMVPTCAVMVNLLGRGSGVPEERPFEKVWRYENATLHVYGKKESRVRRKMGHITIIGDDMQTCINQANELEASVKM